MAKLTAVADDAILLAVVSFAHLRTVLGGSLNRDLACIYEWCWLWGMKLYTS